MATKKNIVAKRAQLPKKRLLIKPHQSIGETQASYLARFIFLSRGDIVRLRKAYALAEVGHKNQVRDSGEPYFTHPRTVSLFLLDLGVTDADLYISALCHDLVEDTVITLEQICNHFGDRVAGIVKTVSIPTKSNGSFVAQEKYEQYYDQLKKGSPEAKLIAILDNLHNLQHLKYCSYEKRKRIAQRTNMFYYPAIADIVPYFPKAKKIEALYKKARTAA